MKTPAKYWAIVDETGKFIQKNAYTGQLEIYENAIDASNAYDNQHCHYDNHKITVVYVTKEPT